MSTDSVKKPMAAIAPFGLRMQPELKVRIEQAASANNRSMNAEIVARLESSFDENAPSSVVLKAIEDSLNQRHVEFAQEMQRKLDTIKKLLSDMAAEALKSSDKQ